jgi:hypothetical protein
MLRSRLFLVAPLVAVAVALSACSTGSPATDGSGGTPAASAKTPPPATASAGAASGSVSTEGVCGLVPLSQVNSILKRGYTTSKEVPLPAITIADAAYCEYGTASRPEQFSIQVATSAPSDAAETFNQAAGNRLAPQSGIGDSAMYTDFFPELLVVWGQSTVVVGQNGSEKGAAVITRAELEKLANAVHAAS